MTRAGAPAFALVLLAGCGVTRSKSSGPDHNAACTYVAKLDEIADGVGHADVHDPDAFKKTLDDAVQDYVTNVKSLRAVAPADLRASLDRVESDVQQYRFNAALTDSADLDQYAARTCARAPAGATSTTGAPPSSSSSSVPLPVTSTSVASGPGSSGLSSGG